MAWLVGTRMPQWRMVLPLVVSLISICSVVQLTADVIQVVRRLHVRRSVRKRLYSRSGRSITCYALAVFALALGARAITIAARLVCHFF